MEDIDIGSQQLLSITEAASLIPGRPHVATVHRWLHGGLQGVKLESWKVGGKRFTSVEAIQRFITATTALANGEPAEAVTIRSRRQAVTHAERIANEHGV